MSELLDRLEARGEERGRQNGVDETRLESIKNVVNNPTHSF